MVLFVLRGNFVRLLVALVVTVEAVGLALEQRRPFASPCPSDRLTRGLVHGKDVVAVHGDAGHIVGRGAVSDVLDATVILRWRRLGIAVILGDKDHRQFPDCGQVEALVQGPLFSGAVAEEADRHLIGLVDLGGEPRATSERRSPTDDTVGAEHPLIHVSNVHRPAFALADAGGFAEQLGHHAAHVHPFGHAVAMPAVGGGHIVGVGEVRTDADGHRLFPGVQVHEAGNLALAELDLDPVLKGADELHPLVHPQQLFLAEIHTLSLLGRTACEKPARVHSMKSREGKQNQMRGEDGTVATLWGGSDKGVKRES